MASFNVHASVAMSASGFAATGLMVGGLASEQEVVLYFFLGTLGGLLPDIDSDGSRSLKIAFSLLSSLLAFLLVFHLAPRFSIVELCLVWLGMFLGIRYGVLWIFTRLTVHRGIFHSIPAAALFGFGTAAAAHHGYGLEPFPAWMAGAFISFGYLLHLVLDELSSVDVAEAALRRSFGTALKLFSRKYWKASVLLYATLSLAYFLTPDIRAFSTVMLEGQTYQRMQDKLVPTESWFQLKRAPISPLAQETNR